MKNEYTMPTFQKEKVKITNTVLSSDVEYFSSYIAGGDDWGDPIFDPDDGINW